MRVLICENFKGNNSYIELLIGAYRDAGFEVICGTENFLYTNFVPDILHIQWPEAIYRWRNKLPAGADTVKHFMDRMNYFREKKSIILYTVHNIMPFDNASAFDREIYRTVILNADIIIHHGCKSIEIIKEVFPESINKRHIVCPHGPYPVKFEDPAQAKLRYSLPQNKYIFVNLGKRRGYKGVDFLRKVFARWNNRRGFLLFIGSNYRGSSDHRAYYRLIHRGLETLDRIIFDYLQQVPGKTKSITRFVPQNELPVVMAASDVLLLGHKEGLNSGLLALAASYGKPVVFPDIGNFMEQVAQWPWKEAYRAGDVNSAVRALDNMMELIGSSAPGQQVYDNREWLHSISWPKHVRLIMEAVREVRRVK